MSVDQDPWWSLLYSLLLTCGLVTCGKWTFVPLGRFLGGNLRGLFGWQTPVFGAAVLSIVVGWGSLLSPGASFYLWFSRILMGLGGVGFFLDLLPSAAKLARGSRFRAAFGKFGYETSGLLAVLLVLYFLANLGPVSNGDSIDYHLGYALNYLRVPFDPHPEWFTGRMAQIGEKLIAVGLACGAFPFSALIQYLGLASLIGLILGGPIPYVSASDRGRGALALMLLSSPVLLFLAISAKPQLMPTAMSALAFALVLRTFLDSAWSDADKKVALFAAITLSLVAATHKFSFLISLFVISCLAAYIAYKIRALRAVVIWSVAMGLLVFFPVYWDKWLRYRASPLVFFTNPAAEASESAKAFLAWVKRYRENPFPFPLYLFLPSSPGNFSTILGVGAAAAVVGVCRLGRAMHFFQVVVFVFLCVLWLVGQPSSRFYLEPYVWMLLMMAANPNEILPKPVDKAAKALVFAQALAVLAALLPYVYGVACSYVPGGQDAFRKKYVNGYQLYRWVESQLPQDEPILLDHRSKSLYAREVYSLDPIEFHGADDKDLLALRDRLISRDVRHVVTKEESLLYPLLSRCSSGVVAGPEALRNASRNPFNAAGVYQAYILSIQPADFIDCVVKQGPL